MIKNIYFLCLSRRHHHLFKRLTIYACEKRKCFKICVKDYTDYGAIIISAQLKLCMRKIGSKSLINMRNELRMIPTITIIIKNIKKSFSFLLFLVTFLLFFLLFLFYYVFLSFYLFIYAHKHKT